ncbi:MAG: hypothetical protein U0807_15115 [Candidatus Binatia bacterium]
MHALIIDDAEELLCPSVVTCDGGRLYFGSEALKRGRRSGSTVFQHLKTCLGCEADVSNARLTGCRFFPTGGSACGQPAAVPDHGQITPTELATCFLAWTFGRARARLSQDTAPNLTFNVGVPVGDHIEDSSLMRRYRRMGSDAWRLSTVMNQGVSLTEAADWIRQLRPLPVPPPEQSKVAYCFEAGAALLAFAMRPGAADGIYGLIDIGAWTSDVAFFHFSPPDETNLSPVVHLYAADSLRVAVNEIDERTVHSVYEVWGLRFDPRQPVGPTADELRGRRERNEFGGVASINGYNRPISAAALAFARDCVRDRLQRQTVELLRGATKKDPRVSHWKGCPVFIVGGGAAETGLWQRLGEGLPVIGTVRAFSDELPLRIPREELAHRFAVAAGLAYPEAMWPKVYAPSEVSEFSRPPVRQTPTLNDLGLDDD